MTAIRLDQAHTAVLMVDMQAKLLPHMYNASALETQVGRLLDGANALEVPILVTEQYRKGLGLTVASLTERTQQAACCVEKLKFSACIKSVRSQLIQLNSRSVIVCGIEAHVCVLQTCLELLDQGYLTFVALDAIGSRRPADREAAIQRLIQAGVVPTTVESALLEIVHEAGGERFKAILPIIR